MHHIEMWGDHMMANDMNRFLRKFERRAHLTTLLPFLPKKLSKQKWSDIIIEDTLETFSRYFPNKVPFTVNKNTCHRAIEDGNVVWYIKDEFLNGLILLGVQDIDWSETGVDNMGVSNTVGLTRYRPQSAGLEDCVTLFQGMSMNADYQSLFNNNIFLENPIPNKIIVSRVGDTDVLINSFVVNLLVQHGSLATISPTKMEVVEQLGFADIADWLYGALKYVDGLETT